MKRLIKKGYLYEMIRFSQPIIVNHTNMLSDNNKGGVLLVYTKTKVIYISLFRHDYALYLINFKQIVAYFKPLKGNWNREAYKIDKIYWGRKNHLLTKLWLEVNTEFKDIFSITSTELAKIPQCKDEKLIKKLNTRSEVFILSNIKTDKK